jgi:hypothetical protein
MLTVSDSIETVERNRGDSVDADWTIPYDVPPAAVTFDFRPGPTLSGADVQKSFAGSCDAYGGRDAWTYSVARVELEAIQTALEARTTGGEDAVDTTVLTARA